MVRRPSCSYAVLDRDSFFGYRRAELRLHLIWWSPSDVKDDSVSVKGLRAGSTDLGRVS